MGGFGSGRPATRATVEGCRSLKLDVNRLVRPARKAMSVLFGDHTVTVGPSCWTWTHPDDERPWATVTVFLHLGLERGSARLIYNVDHRSRATGPQDQRVEMVTTPCRFGGVRWWWVCPASGRRCVTLYLPNGGVKFLSRGPGAYHLSYASQSDSAIHRSHGRLARLHRRLGDEYTSLPDIPPPRPKWMRWRTYARLTAEWEKAAERHDRIFISNSELLLQRLGQNRFR